MKSPGFPFHFSGFPSTPGSGQTPTSSSSYHHQQGITPVLQMNEPSEQDIDESPTASSDSSDNKGSNRKPFKKNLRVAIPQQKNFSAPITRLPVSSNTQQVAAIHVPNSDPNARFQLHHLPVQPPRFLLKFLLTNTQRPLQFLNQ
jgi:hypothetical protein